MFKKWIDKIKKKKGGGAPGDLNQLVDNDLDMGKDSDVNRRMSVPVTSKKGLIPSGRSQDAHAIDIKLPDNQGSQFDPPA